MPLIWKGAEYLEGLEKRTYNRLQTASGFLANQIKLKLSMGQPPGPAGGPPHVLSGMLRNSIDYQMVDGETSRVGVQVGPANKYALIHELGGDIFPKRAKALRFKTADGKWHTVKHVRIPSRPYLRPALDENFQQLEKIIAGKE